MADAEKLKKEETLKKPVKQDRVKKETTDESTILSLLSTQSEVMNESTVILWTAFLILLSRVHVKDRKICV